MLVELSIAEINGILQMAEVVNVRGTENLRQLLALTDKLRLTLSANGAGAEPLNPAVE